MHDVKQVLGDGIIDLDLSDAVLKLQDFLRGQDRRPRDSTGSPLRWLAKSLRSSERIG